MQESEQGSECERMPQQEETAGSNGSSGGSRSKHAALVGQAREQLRNVMSVAPEARRWRPREEHLIPLHVAFGAAYPTSQATTTTTASSTFTCTSTAGTQCDIDTSEWRSEQHNAGLSTATETWCRRIHHFITLSSMSLDSNMFFDK